MKAHRQIFVLIPLLAVVGLQQCPQRAVAQSASTAFVPSKKLRISALIKKGETKDSLILEWSLKNISRKNADFRDTYVLRDYKFTIRDSEGHIIAPTPAGQEKIYASLFVSHRDSVTLQPRQQVKRSLILTEIYDLKPGRVYEIFLERHLSLDKGKTFEDVRSNIVKAKVENNMR